MGDLIDENIVSLGKFISSKSPNIALERSMVELLFFRSVEARVF